MRTRRAFSILPISQEAIIDDDDSLSRPIAERSPVAARLLTWRDAMLALLAGGLSLALYVRTLVPFVLTGDSAEFQVLAYQLGIAHTPATRCICCWPSSGPSCPSAISPIG